MQRDVVLFLCVQNSARSQLAEAIARELAPAGIEVCSAGSAPRAVRPQVLTVLAEVGLDASAHRSKGLDDVPADRVRVVVTLCAEEVCPTLPGDVERLHWPLPDPAAVQDSAEASLAAFRAVRDELQGRLRSFFADSDRFPSD